MGHCGFFGTKEKEEDREGKGRKQGAREGGEEKGRKEEKIGERGTGGGCRLLCGAQEAAP